ncbi:uncharacterized protein LOC142324917 isoform X2 [Lycorma delicatula]|uniref:uncharacterized protein LOC142324917 isoform X2 n=1 Tax=Lycorma delicatula TaxID=130591 RepID=UPI003F5152E4
MEVVVDSLVKNNEIPIVDITHMERVKVPARPWVKKAASHLVRGVTNTGLVFIVNHGITEEKLQKGYRVMKKFCDLPEEIRMMHACKKIDQLGVERLDIMPRDDHLHGYVPPGTDRHVRERMEEIRHTYNIMDLGDGKAVLPEYVPGFQDAASVLADEFKRVAIIVLQLLAVGLDMDPNFFLCKHQRMLNNEILLKSRSFGFGDVSGINDTLLRIVYYPPLGDRTIPGMMRARQRIECGSFTVLAQDSEGGLEVFMNSKWQRVGHLPGALLINMGTMMEDWTTGRFKAMKCRVVIPEQRSVRSRGHFNIAFHVHPEDVIVPYPVVSSTTTENQIDHENDNFHQSAVKWPLTVTIISAYQSMQTRLQQFCRSNAELAGYSQE